MAAVQYFENLIRLALNVRSNPPLPPTDDLTGERPAFWRGASVAIQLGIFDIYGVGADLSNLAFLQFSLLPAPIPNQRVCTNLSYAEYSFNPYPTTPPAPLLNISIPAANLTTNITVGDWEEGTAQNAVIILDWVQTQLLNLGGQPFKQFVFSVQGVTVPDSLGFSRRITYGGGAIDVYESGVSGVYLPNTVTPIDVPDGTILYIEPNQQMVFSSTISVEGTIQIEGTMIQT